MLQKTILLTKEPIFWSKLHSIAYSDSHYNTLINTPVRHTRRYIIGRWLEFSLKKGCYWYISHHQGEMRSPVTCWKFHTHGQQGFVPLLDEIGVKFIRSKDFPSLIMPNSLSFFIWFTRNTFSQDRCNTRSGLPHAYRSQQWLLTIIKAPWFWATGYYSPLSFHSLRWVVANC